MSRIITHNNVTWTGIPFEYLGTFGAFGGSGNGFTNSSYPLTNALTNSSSSTYAQFTPASTNVGGGRFGFNITGIPENATINSVTCLVKIRCSGNGFTTAEVQLYAGDTAKGTALDFTNDTSTTARSYTTTGSWTRAEIDTLELRFSTRKSSNANRYIVILYIRCICYI